MSRNEKKKNGSIRRFFAQKPEFINKIKNHPVTKAFYRAWKPVFAGIKIAIGAVSTILLILLVCGFVFAGILGDYFEDDILPNAAVVLDDYDMDAPSYVYCVNSDGEIELLQELYASTDWKKATYDEIPQALIHAAVAIEDKRFYEHQGVDWLLRSRPLAICSSAARLSVAPALPSS